MGHYLHLTLSAGLLLLLESCNEFSYDPSFSGDAPYSPGTEWRCGRIAYPCKSMPKPYSEADLSRTLTVPELLDIALYNNPATRVSWMTARAAAFGYEGSFSEYYPTIVYTGTVTIDNNTIGKGTGSGPASTVPGSIFQNTNITGNGAISSTSSSTTSTSNQIETLFNEITASWLMFDFGGRDAQVELARQILIAADWQHNFTMQQVMLSVLTAYTGYIGNKALVVGYRQDLEDAKTLLKSAEVMYKAGLSTLTDVLQAKSTLEQAKLNLAEAEGAERTSFGELIIALGLSPHLKIAVVDLPDKLPIVNISGDIDSFLETAKYRRPDLGAAIAAVKQQEADLAISFSAGMPIMTANGVLSRTHFFHNPSLDGHNNSIAISVTAPLFEGFFYLNQQRQIRAQIEEALANVEVQLSAVATQVVTDYYAFTTAVEAIPSSEAILAYSERAYRGYLAQYKVGTASLLDAVNALTILSNARAQRVVIRTQWAASLANLAFAAGILTDDKGDWSGI